MTQYLLSVYMNDSDEMPPEEDIQRMYKAVDEFNEKVRSAGAWVFAGGLEPIEAATIVTDGPYVESKEYLGGFWVIEAPDLDAALTWAKEGSAACEGRVEVRPFQAEPA
jgi:hypothetical protein